MVLKYMTINKNNRWGKFLLFIWIWQRGAMSSHIVVSVWCLINHQVTMALRFTVMTKTYFIVVASTFWSIFAITKRCRNQLLRIVPVLKASRLELKWVGYWNDSTTKRDVQLFQLITLSINWYAQKSKILLLMILIHKINYKKTGKW